MAEYKCISCGCVKESKEKCSCTECGYQMFALPYNRKNVLIAETQVFIESLLIKKISDRDFFFYRFEDNEKIYKFKDDARFPDLDKIKGYVCAAEKTEAFIQRVNTTLEQIKNHINTPFEMTYMVDYDEISDRSAHYETTLKKVVEYFGIDCCFEELKFEEAKAFYSETPSTELLALANEVIVALQNLTLKIHKFVKQNNIYGTTYQKKFSSKVEFKSKADCISLLNRTEKNIVDIINKKYVVDIFSDGQDELVEMLKCLWNGISVLMNLPILEKKYTFDYCGEELEEKDFYKKILDVIHSRYASVYTSVLSDMYFENKSEDDLFEIYNKMIELDTFDFFGVNQSSLLRPGEYEKKLNSLIGLAGIKESIKKIKAYALSNKDSDALNLHMCFYGNPGTGKTEVARIIAGILYENKILPTKKVIEVDRSDLVGEYLGETPQKTMDVIDSAMGGVLFIDEAYSLAPKDVKFDYGHEAVAALIKAMEDRRGKFCVILAGYKNQMLDMISTNPGFKSRIQFQLDFPNYSREEMRSIASLMLTSKKYTANDAAIQKMLDITDVKRREPNFANAREIRNIIDGVIMCQNLRTLGTENTEIGITDVNKYIEDNNINLPLGSVSNKILTAEEELEQLVGLDSVKRMVKKIKAYAKRNKNESDFNLHMCFYGNPGTGKTEVARILSSILYDAGVLAEAKLIETDAHGLIGKVVGETAPKTQAKISDAMGGVLFIDEAYGLTNSATNQSYGEEAIEVLLKNMEDHRGKFCTILAGYKKEMKDMLDSNPGFESRIQFTLDFPDYTREELGQIATKFLTKKKYTIDTSALELLLDVAEYYRNRDNFANARTVRNILDQVIMNQNLRTEDDEDDGTIILSDVEDFIADEDIDLKNSSKGTNKIGFI